jgi:uncharacterized protein YdiU (UPF0061 family)
MASARVISPALDAKPHHPPDTARRDAVNAPIPFDNSYARLGDPYSAGQMPEAVRKPALIRVNEALAAELGIDATWLASDAGVSALAGNALPPGATPIATAYAGHQFGQFNPQLGDGRAVLLGEVIDRHGRRRDLQLKGSGRTPWSRGGDGRSPLGPVLREYIVSEAMHALGVPTTRALAAVSSGERVYREGPEPGAVLTRVASSHLRVGTCEYFAARQQHDALRELVAYTLERHYPDRATEDNAALALLDAVTQAQAGLIARWQLLGFIHGVMNTDNMLLCGETIDYGPCAFMEAYDPATVFSSIDVQGRYAYGNQPGIAHWNLARLAEALLPLIDSDSERAIEAAKGVLATFPARFGDAHSAGIAAKLGLARLADDADRELAEALFTALKADGADFTLAFRFLADEAQRDGAGSGAGALLDPGAALLEWLPRWKQRPEREDSTADERQRRMFASSPAFIARNHQVQHCIEAAEDGDFAPFHRLVERLARPFDWAASDRDLARPATERERVHRTFCGT